MINAVYLDTVAQIARAAMSGAALPSITAKLLAQLPITAIFFSGAAVVTIDEGTGKCVIKPKDAPAGTPSLIDAVAELVTVGSETHYLFEWASADSVELRAFLDAQADPSQAVEMRCEIEYAIDGKVGRVAFPIFFATSYTRPEDPAPSATSDASWLWLKDRELAGSGIVRTVDDTAKTLTWSAPGIATNATAITSEATTRAGADTTLQNNIDAEATTRAGADTTLQGNIDAEAGTRAGADTALQSNIDAVLPSKAGNAGKLLAVKNDESAYELISPSSGGLPRGYIAGLVMVYNSTTMLSIAAGVCRDDSNLHDIDLAALSKNISANFAEGNGNGGLQAGLTLAVNTNYSVWVIKNTAIGMVDVMFSTSATAPTLPAGYTVKRRIGWVRNLGGGIQNFIQRGDNIRFLNAVTDALPTLNPASNDTLITLGAPPDVLVTFRYYGTATSGTWLVRLAMVAEGANATVNTFNVSFAGGGTSNPDAGHAALFTDSNSQIRARASGATVSTTFTTLGWVDSRGRDD